MSKNLKPFDELSEDELLSLTSDDITWYKQRAALEAGIVLAPNPGKPPKKPEIPRDAKYLASTGISITIGNEIMFVNASDLFKITDMLRDLAAKGLIVCEKYDYNVGYDFRYADVVDMQDVGTSQKTLFSEETFDQYKDQMREWNVAQKEYNKLESAYNKYERAMSDVTSEITDKLNNVQAKRIARQGLIAAWQQYSSLGYDESSALTFFALAYRDKLDEYEFTPEYIRQCSKEG